MTPDSPLERPNKAALTGRPSLDPKDQNSSELPSKIGWLTALEAPLYGIAFLVFLQLLSDFVETIYAFGLLRVSLTGEIASVILFFAPLGLLAARKGCSKTALALLGGVTLLARLVMVWLGPSGKLIAAGIGVGCWLTLFPAWLWYLSHAALKDATPGKSGVALGLGLTGGLGMSILLRTLGAGFDISTYGSTQVCGWLIVAVGGWGLWRRVRNAGVPPAITTSADAPHPRFGAVVGLCVGVSSALAFGYFALMSPNVIARWTGVAHPVIVSALLLALSVWGWLWLTRPRWLIQLPRAGLWLLNGLFILALILTLRAHQIDFPTDAGAYPLAEPASPVWGQIALWALLFLSPVVLLDFILCVRALLALRPTLPQLGGGMAVGALWLLLLILAQVFTTVYDYIPVIGPAFRDRYWLVFLAVGLGCAIPAGLLRRPPDDLRPITADRPSPHSALLTPLWGGLCALTLIIAWGFAPRPPTAPVDDSTLRVLTYNIQQGYSAEGVKDFAGQLAVLREADADLIGLQETDTNRVAGGNADIVGYFARELRMYSYYGPSPAAGTFGVALLSKYPIEAAETFYMHSLGEQTATIAARVRVGEQRFNVFVTHLGNGGPLVQQEAVMERVQDQPNVILMGDFNFRPDSDPYRLTTMTLEDAWVVQAAPVEPNPAFDPQQRIDHLFVSPGTRVERAQYLVSPHSDHPALWVDISVVPQ